MKSLSFPIYATVLALSSIAVSPAVEASLIADRVDIEETYERTYTLASTLTETDRVEYVKGDDFNEDNLSILCENSPFNSRCKDWEPAIALEDRPGQKTECQLTPTTINLGVPCKLNIAEGTITVYIEKRSDGPSAIGGEKSTLAVSVPIERIFSVFTSKTIRGVDGSGLRSKVVIEIGFIVEPSEDAPNRTNYLKIVTSKEDILDKFYNINVPNLSDFENQNSFRTATFADLMNSPDE